MKYKTIVDNLNVYYKDEVIEQLKEGSIIEVEKITPAIDQYGRSIKIAVLKDGNEIIAEFAGKVTIEPVKTKTSKKGDK